jgi:hypothetical protein
MYDELKAAGYTPPGRKPSPTSTKRSYFKRLPPAPAIDTVLFDMQMLDALNVFVANPFWKYDAFTFPEKPSSVRRLSFSGTGDDPESMLLDGIKCLANAGIAPHMRMLFAHAAESHGMSPRIQTMIMAAA